MVANGSADSAPNRGCGHVQYPAGADAGANQTAQVGDTVVLDGTGSSDADNDPLTFLWSFTSQPGASTATLDDPTLAAPSFNADVEGHSSRSNRQ